MLPINNLQSVNITTVGKTANRPSSPRQFFERLYGHLEERVVVAETFDDCDNGTGKMLQHSAELSDRISSNELNTSICDTSTYQSDGGSVSSPDISISDERCA